MVRRIWPGIKPDFTLTRFRRKVRPMILEIPPGEFGAYIFDCDGTLADTMPLHYQAWLSVLRPLGADMPEDVFYSCGGMPTWGVVEYLNERYGYRLNPMETAHAKEAKFVELIPGVKPVEPVVEFMRGVIGKAPLAVASGGFRKVVEDILHNLDLHMHFQAIVTAEDVVHGKPAPDTYLEAARRLGVAPERCLVFEDTPLGIESGRNAGMQTVLVPSGPVVDRKILS